MDTTCKACPDVLVHRGTWDGWTKAQRRAARAEGKARLQARGLCARCYSAEKKAGRLIDHERVITPAAWRAEDYDTVRDELDPTLPPKVRVRVAAHRLGVNEHTLASALKRAGVAA